MLSWEWLSGHSYPKDHLATHSVQKRGTAGGWVEDGLGCWAPEAAQQGWELTDVCPVQGLKAAEAAGATLAKPLRASGGSQGLGHKLATPNNVWHPYVAAGGTATTIWYFWAHSWCIAQPSSWALEVSTVGTKHAHRQVFCKDTKWLPVSSSWSGGTAVVLIRFPPRCSVCVEYKQWHMMCGPRRSEQRSTEPNLGRIKACYGMYIDVTFVLQCCNTWIMMSWYAR